MIYEDIDQDSTASEAGFPIILQENIILHYGSNGHPAGWLRHTEENHGKPATGQGAER
jgi:hypothetical protein